MEKLVTSDLHGKNRKFGSFYSGLFIHNTKKTVNCTDSC